MTKDEALRLALEALENLQSLRQYHKAIAAIKQALAQPEPEPDIYPDEAYELGLERIAYYTSPPKREPLTDERTAFEAYCKTLHPLWNASTSRTQAEEFFHAGWQAAYGIKGEA